MGKQADVLWISPLFMISKLPIESLCSSSPSTTVFPREFVSPLFDGASEGMGTHCTTRSQSWHGGASRIQFLPRRGPAREKEKVSGNKQGKRERTTTDLVDDPQRTPRVKVVVLVRSEGLFRCEEKVSSSSERGKKRKKDDGRRCDKT
jgi:hypothetical protein